MKMEYIRIGKINKKILNYNFLSTEEVIFTNERQLHVRKNHNKDLNLYFKYLKKAIEKPEYIILDLKHKNTVMFIKKVNKNYINIVVRLAIKEDIKHEKNSIMTLYM